jgi:hypothetical protein
VPLVERSCRSWPSPNSDGTTGPWSASCLLCAGKTTNALYDRNVFVYVWICDSSACAHQKGMNITEPKGQQMVSSRFWARTATCTYVSSVKRENLSQHANLPARQLTGHLLRQYGSQPVYSEAL